ncbi:MAG: hypothetical protein M4579_006100 [Chaenotheca gracillima]|nr:MAG: hypothetical protein M4579_006100 [Chaenotheca gracillima]
MVRISLPNRLKSYNSTKGSASQDPSRSSSPARLPAEPRSSTTLILKTTVIKAKNLTAKDKSGTSDPFVVISLGDARSVTHAVSKTLHPEWNTSFELPIVGEQSLLLECVCWDKDRFGKDYLGEFDVALEDIFTNERTEQEPRWYPLKSKQKDARISGEVQLQFAIYDTSSPPASPRIVIQKFRDVASITPESDEQEGDLSALEQTETLDEDEVGEGTSETDDPTKPEAVEKKRRRLRLAKLKRKSKARAYEFSGGSDVVGILFMEISKITDLPPERNMTRTSFDMDPFVVASLGKKTYRTRVIRHNLNPIFEERMIFQVLRHEQNYSLSFSVVDRDKLSGNDFVGTTSVALQDIVSTAPDADGETGLYSLREPPDASKLAPTANRSRFRLPLSRSSSANSLTRLSSRPPLRSHNSSSSINNDSQPELRPPPTSAPTSAQAPTPGPVPASPSEGHPAAPGYHGTEHGDAFDGEGDPDLKPYVMSLNLKNKERWETKHNPELFIKAKYVPYPALRQQFWRSMLKQYDADESSYVSKVELSTMLDTLGSTLKESTIDSFFQRFAPDGTTDLNNVELTFDQAVICLEDQLEQASQKRHLGDTLRDHLNRMNPNQSNGDTSGTNTPMTTSSTPALPLNNTSSTAIPAIETEFHGSAGEEGDTLAQDDLSDGKNEEHVVEIRECPICHQPRLNKKSDADIITHIATCASHDWRQVNNLVMAGFVTSSQAQRKWYSKVVNKVSYGGYKLGANSANILVQDRTTGQINEERMSVYVRLGIRLLYKGLKSRDMEKKRIRKLLKSLSVKQGTKYDDPASAREIGSFINFHQLDMSEVLLPQNEFKTFNQFFYRALKPTARPCSAPDNPKIIVSPADCRSVVFNTIDDATSIWVKGREFSVARLLGKAYPEDAKRYVNGALGIYRLAPQDYHRFHIPVDGVMDTPKTISGEYYTVNPMAIRSALDVYGENVRVVVPIDSVAHGRVMVICVGAMMVGSTVITAKAGQKVTRAEELGYFKFGGSTILLLFEPGRMKFDQDLVDNSKSALETLVRVGMSVGHSPEQAAHTPDMQKEKVTHEERQEAKRRIAGSLAPAPPGAMA